MYTAAGWLQLAECRKHEVKSHLRVGAQKASQNPSWFSSWLFDCLKCKTLQFVNFPQNKAFEGLFALFVSTFEDVQCYSQYLAFWQCWPFSYLERELSASWSMPKHFWGVSSVCLAQTCFFFDQKHFANVIVGDSSSSIWEAIIPVPECHCEQIVSSGALYVEMCHYPSAHFHSVSHQSL